MFLLPFTLDIVIYVHGADLLCSAAIERWCDCEAVYVPVYTFITKWTRPPMTTVCTVGKALKHMVYVCVCVLVCACV